MSGGEAPCGPVLGWVLKALAESSALVLVALVLERWVLVGRLAGARAGLWWLVLARLVLPVEALLPRGSLAPLGDAALARTLAAPGSTLAAATAQASFDLAAWGPWLAALWGVGVVLALGRLGAREARLRRRVVAFSRPAPEPLCRAARRVARRLGLTRAPELRLAPGPALALVAGLRRPVVVLSEGLSPRARRGALWHETMHVRRRDLPAQFLFEVVRALWWFHPLLGVACRRARAAREVACDLAVVRRLKARPAARYQALLRAQARDLLASAPAPVGALALLGQPADLVVRLGALARRPGRRHRAAGRALALGLACLLLLGACGEAPPGAGATWWDDAGLARAEARRWVERRPGLGCKPGQLVFLRALALERAAATGRAPPE